MFVPCEVTKKNMKNERREEAGDIERHPGNSKNRLVK